MDNNYNHNISYDNEYQNSDTSMYIYTDYVGSNELGKNEEVINDQSTMIQSVTEYSAFNSQYNNYFENVGMQANVPFVNIDCKGSGLKFGMLLNKWRAINKRVLIDCLSIVLCVVLLLTPILPFAQIGTDDFKIKFDMYELRELSGMVDNNKFLVTIMNLYNDNKDDVICLIETADGYMDPILEVLNSVDTFLSFGSYIPVIGVFCSIASDIVVFVEFINDILDSLVEAIDKGIERQISDFFNIIQNGDEMLIVSLVFIYVVGIGGIITVVWNRKLMRSILSLIGIVIFAWICSFFDDISVSMGIGGYLIGICSILLFVFNLYGIFNKKAS